VVLNSAVQNKSRSLQEHAALRRCSWCGDDPLYVAYHDEEWGVPLHDDRRLFEMLILEGAQAGLSWITILRKRPAYRRAFDRFDPKNIAAYKAPKLRALMNDAGIVRNKLKIEAAVKNAKAFLAIQKEFGSFDTYIWQFVGGKPIVNRRTAGDRMPATTPESDAMSKALKQRGFTFVGSTICYAFMQATGMVNDHLTECISRKV
jgi:DNA-3-methyladenine glycosylase I